MGKNFSTENDNPESEREHNDDRSYNLFRPMSDEDYPYKEPGEKMTPKQFISRAMIVVLIVVAALFVLLIVEVEDYRRTRSEKEAQREASRSGGSQEVSLWELRPFGERL